MCRRDAAAKIQWTGVATKILGLRERGAPPDHISQFAAMAKVRPELEHLVAPAWPRRPPLSRCPRRWLWSWSSASQMPPSKQSKRSKRRLRPRRPARPSTRAGARVWGGGMWEVAGRKYEETLRSRLQAVESLRTCAMSLLASAAVRARDADSRTLSHGAQRRPRRSTEHGAQCRCRAEAWTSLFVASRRLPRPVSAGAPSPTCTPTTSAEI